MITTYSKNKKFVFPVLVALLIIAVSAVSMQSVQAQTTTEESDIDQLYDILDSQYDAILEKYGFVTPELTDEQEIKLDAELAPLDEQYWELEGEFEYYEISPEMEEKYEKLDMQYNAILEQFGFSFPELIEEQEIKLDAELAPLDEQYEEIFEKFDQENLTEEQEEQLESLLDELDSKYSKILREFGIVEPVLTEQQEMELEELLAPLEEQYELLDEQYDSFHIEEDTDKK